MGTETIEMKPDDPRGAATPPTTRPVDQNGDGTFNIKGIPIFSVGTWNTDVYNEKDLDGMADAYGKVGFKPPLKIGHDEKQIFGKNDGMPALGWVNNLRRDGTKLLADFMNVPRKIYDLVKRKAYDRVSAEVYWNYKNAQLAGGPLPRVLKAVALLGADIPAVTNLGSILDLYSQQGDTVKIYTDVSLPLQVKTYQFPAKKSPTLQPTGAAAQSSGGEKEDEGTPVAQQNYSIKQTANKKWAVFQGDQQLQEFPSEEEARAFQTEMEAAESELGGSAPSASAQPPTGGVPGANTAGPTTALPESASDLSEQDLDTLIPELQALLGEPEGSPDKAELENALLEQLGNLLASKSNAGSVVASPEGQTVKVESPDKKQVTLDDILSRLTGSLPGQQPNQMQSQQLNRFQKAGVAKVYGVVPPAAPSIASKVVGGMAPALTAALAALLLGSAYGAVRSIIQRRRLRQKISQWQTPAGPSPIPGVDPNLGGGASPTAMLEQAQGAQDIKTARADKQGAESTTPRMSALNPGETITFGPQGERGVWRTVGGRAIFIKVGQGESVPDAVRRQQGGGAYKKTDAEVHAYLYRELGLGLRQLGAAGYRRLALKYPNLAAKLAKGTERGKGLAKTAVGHLDKMPGGKKGAAIAAGSLGAGYLYGRHRQKNAPYQFTEETTEMKITEAQASMLNRAQQYSIREGEDQQFHLVMRSSGRILSSHKTYGEALQQEKTYKVSEEDKGKAWGRVGRGIAKGAGTGAAVGGVLGGGYGYGIASFLNGIEGFRGTGRLIPKNKKPSSWKSNLVLTGLGAAGGALSGIAPGAAAGGVLAGASTPLYLRKLRKQRQAWLDAQGR